MSKKKAGIIVGVVVVAAAVTAGTWAYQTGMFSSISDNGDRVYVTSVEQITGTATGVQNRYSGVVEAQETWEVNLDSDRTVKEVYVAVGDSVEEGTPLFVYDTDEIQSQIDSANLELEGIANDITGYNNQIAALEKERDGVAETDKFEYTTQIQSIQASIRQSEYDQKSKQAEIDKYQASIDSSVVTSKIAGMVKTLNSTGSSDDGSDAYMTILATGDYRVKGIVNEQNVGLLTTGTEVILRSRVDDTLTWKGTIAKIDTENQITSSNDYSSDSSDDSTTSTKYPFYITLESTDGLMLGQHLYIELNDGQEDVKDGIWLYSYYINMDDPDAPFVWADNGSGKLEKLNVTLGEYDESLDEYEITDGLTEDTLIAWPMDSIYEGVKTVTNEEDVDYDSPMYSSDSEDLGSYSVEDYGSFDAIDLGSYTEDGVVEDYNYDEEAVDESTDTENADSEGTDENADTTYVENGDSTGDATEDTGVSE